MADIYGQLVVAQAENLSSDPAGVPTGRIYFNTSSNIMKWYDSTAWRIAVSRDATETLTNKTLTSPQVNSGVLLTCNIDDYVDINEEAAPATPSSGKVRLYAKTDKKLWITDSAGVASQVGASSGSGEINLVESPSDAVGWTTTGANGPVPTTTTTAGNLPLAGTIDTALLLTSATAAGAEASHYASYTLAVGNSLLNRKLKVEFWMRALTNFIASEWTVSIYSGSTRMALSTDVAGVTYLPALSGKFTTSFDADASTAYTVRFSRPVNAGTNAALVGLAGIVVGPGVQPQSAAVGAPQAYTMTVSNNGSKLFTITAYGSRIGEYLAMDFKLQGDATASGANDGTTFLLNMPSGLTINTALMAGSGNHCGHFTTYGVVGAATYDQQEAVYVNVAGSLRFVKGATGAYHLKDTLNVARVMIYGGNFLVPIAEWAGSGTLNVGQNDVEYAYNSSVTDAADTTSFAYGPGGTQIGNFTAARAKRVRFQTPIGASDVLQLEFSSDSGVTWLPLNGQGDVTQQYATQNATNYGVKISPVSATDVDVTFAQYRVHSGATYGSAGVDWTAVDNDPVYKWRVRKVKSGQAVGFGLVGQSTSGLVKAAGQLVGITSGVAAAAGDVGEVIRTAAMTNTTMATSDTDVTGASITLTAGRWRIGYNIEGEIAAGSSISDRSLGNLAIYTSADVLVAETESRCGAKSTVAVANIVNVPLSGSTILDISASTTYKLRGSRTDVAGTGAFTVIVIPNQAFYAVRIA